MKFLWQGLEVLGFELQKAVNRGDILELQLKVTIQKLKLGVCTCCNSSKTGTTHPPVAVETDPVLLSNPTASVAKCILTCASVETEHAGKIEKIHSRP